MTIKHILPGLLIAGACGLASCNKQAFVDANTNPDIVYAITPQEQFLNAVRRAHNNDFEAFYDTYRRIMPWMQMNTPLDGNSRNFLNETGNFNQRYSTFYPELGVALTDVQKIIEAKPEGEQAAFRDIHEIAEIMKIQYAFYVSDINGSIPYTEAFLARYGGPTNPAYQTQPELFDLWDKKLAEIVNTLNTPASVTQESLQKTDLYYRGDVSKWVKAANALRMRIALRWMERDNARASSIINDALSIANAQMTGNEDGWVFFTDVSFTSGGNWLPEDFRAPRPTVDFMWKNNDPRISLFYQKNDFSQENFEKAKAAGLYPAGATWNPRQFVGAPISPDSSQGKYSSWFDAKKVSDDLSLDTVSFLQWRMWQPASTNGTTDAGTGQSFFDVLTYADYCFMRAEAIARGLVTSGSAEEWYNKGIEASIRFYDDAAKKAMVLGYEPLGATAVTDYLNSPDVKFDASRALEQIITQAYLNFYKQPNEAWANYKRTGIPNSSTALANEDIRIDGTVRQIPRRAALNVPLKTDQNFDTRGAALQQMAAEPGFGEGPGDVFGRVWWDVP